MAENAEQRRSFLGPEDETRYFISTPNAEIIRGADWVYSKTYTRCLQEGITTSSEMMDILTKRGIIGPEFEQRSSELVSILNEKIIKLDSATTIEEKRDAAIEVASGREELFQWNQRLNGPMSNTCEQMSDDARLEFLTSSMIVKEDGKRVWVSYDEYLAEKRQSLALRSRFEIMLYLQGLDSDFLEKTPEALAMREIESDLIRRAEDALRVARAIEEERRQAEASEQVEVEIETETHKKRGRKKGNKNTEEETK
jgi:hypothetical protein